MGSGKGSDGISAQDQENGLTLRHVAMEMKNEKGGKKGKVRVYTVLWSGREHRSGWSLTRESLLKVVIA